MMEKTYQIRKWPLYCWPLLIFILMFSSGAYGQSIQVSLEQTRTGPASAPYDPAEWQNGNVNSQHAHFVEGYSIGYRTVITNLTPGTYIEMDLEFDTRHGGANALDFLTYFYNIDPVYAGMPSHEDLWGHHPPAIDPLIGYAGMGAPQYITILPPTTAAAQFFNEFNADNPGMDRITIWGGTPAPANAFEYLSEGALVGNTSSTSFRIKFTATQSTVIISWGGHIAREQDWGTGNSAGGISGSPYHMRILNWNIGNLGNMDRSMQAAAILTIPTCEFEVTPVVCDNTNVMASLIGSPKSGVTYSWALLNNTSGASPTSGSGTSFNFNSGNQAGSVTVQLTASVAFGGSTIEVVCEEEVNVSKIDLSLQGFPATCYGDDDGSISATFSNGLAPYRIRLGGGAWVENATSPHVFNNLPAGNYTVYIEDDAGCTASAQVNVDEPPQLVVDYEAEDILCFGESAEISISISGGTAPYDLQGSEEIIIGDEIVFSIGAGESGTYTIVDENGCEAQVNVILQEPEELLADYIADDILCYGEEADVTITAVGGTAPYFLYEGAVKVGDFVGDEITISLGDGAHSFTVVDSNECNVLVEFTLTEPDELLLTLTPTDLDCYGDGSGEISASWVGGTGPFDIYLDNVLVMADVVSPYVFSNLDAGTFNVEVMDANGCAVDDDVTVSQPDELLLTLTPTDLDCYGDGSGEISASWVGGTGPFDIYLDNVLVMADVVSPYVFSNLDAGTFNVEIMDANGCADDDDVTVSQPDELLLTLTPTDLDCYGDGSGEISASWVGGTGPFDIYLDGMLHEADVTSPFVFAGLDADDYNVEVMDANGCAVDDDVTVSQPDELLLTLTPTDLDCYGDGSGEISASWVGGTGPFDIYLDGMLHEADVTSPFVFLGLDADDYNVEVMDANGCADDEDVTVSQPDELLLTLTPTDLDCYGDGSGEISASWVGGTGPFDIYLDGMPHEADVTSPFVFAGLDADDYNVEVMDANGCAVDDDVTVSQPDELLLTLTPTDLDCYGDGSGEISASWVGGTGPFDIYLDNVLVMADVVSPYVFSNLDAGTFNVEVMDANGCAVDDDVTVSQPDELLLTLTPTDLDCYGDGSGEISASWVGGTGPFDIYLDNVLVMSDVVSPYVFSNLDAGTFNVEVMDANGCADDDDVTVSQPAELLLTLTPTDLDCYGDGSGEISASWVGGTGPFDIYLDNVLVMADVVSPYVFSNLDAGTFNVEIMDANGCADDDDVTVSQPAELLLTLTPTDLDCYGDGSGEISASWVGGTGPFDIYLDNVLVMADVVSPYVFSNLDAGTFNVEIMDANGCADDDDVTVSQPDELLLTLTPTDLDCYGDGSGEISASWVGGTGPFDIYLDGMLHEADVTSPFVFLGLDADVYNVEVMDANGCADDEDVTVSQPDELVCEITEFAASDCEASNGSATVLVSGGTGPYSYTWKDEFDNVVGTEATAIGLSGGIYTVHIMDANGCETSCEVTIEEIPCEEVCETAFAKAGDGICFIPQFSRWGWTNLIEGPGTYEWELWAAAGQCDTDNGELAGTVTVVYDGDGNVSVTFNVESPWRLEETHVYAGETMFPQVSRGRRTTSTVAPGQYFNAGPFDGGPIYVIAHAVVCKYVPIGSVYAVAEETSTKGSANEISEMSELDVVVHPNPFRGQTQVSFRLDKSSRAVVEVFTIQGSRVATLFDGQVQAGDLQSVTFSPDEQPGQRLYLVVVRTDYGRVVRQILQH
jgi:hypothetical protein